MLGRRAKRSALISFCQPGEGPFYRFFARRYRTANNLRPFQIPHPLLAGPPRPGLRWYSRPRNLSPISKRPRLSRKTHKSTPFTRAAGASFAVEGCRQTVYTVCHAVHWRKHIAAIPRGMYKKEMMSGVESVFSSSRSVIFVTGRSKGKGLGGVGGSTKRQRRDYISGYPRTYGILLTMTYTLTP